MSARRGPLAELRRAVLAHRRVLAAGLAAGAVALGLHAVRPPAPQTIEVLAAARDLPAGVAVAEGDLTTVALATNVVPSGALAASAEVVGRSLTGPVRRGEPITDVRLLGPSLLDGLAGTSSAQPGGLVATAVRVADAESVSLVRAGDRVDLLATPVGLGTEVGETRTVAAEVVVLAVPAAADGSAATGGALVVVAATEEQAADLAGAAVTSRIAVTLRG